MALRGYMKYSSVVKRFFSFFLGGSGGSGGAYIPSYQFDDARNSMYLAR